jgi:arginine utilization protein RocB
MTETPGQDRAHSDWYETVRHFTKRLVKIRSVSPGEGEVRAAHKVLHLLCEHDAGPLYTACGLDPIESDPYDRQNAYALLRGESRKTLVLLGHIDTVDTQDYGSLEAWALDPAELAARKNELTRSASSTGSCQDDHDWMFGRGVVDMKSGVAINIALMRHLAASTRESPLPLSVVMLATPDEENESAGVLQAVRFLLRLRESYGLEYLGVINTDYTTALYPGDPHRYIYAGTVGKLLPCFLCIGRESHAADPFKGLDANLLAAELIRDLSMNDELCDAVQGQVAAPPVTLHATDLKARYDVQLPFAAYFYLNMLTLTTDPGALLERLSHRAQTVLTQLLQRIDQAEQRWRQARPDRQESQAVQPRSGTVLTYADLYTEVTQHLGKERVAAELGTEWERWPATLDKRERSLHLAYRLWTLSGRQGPAVLLYYAPPYYPHVAPAPGALQQAIAAVISAHLECQLAMRDYYPYLSDMSYLRLDPGMDLTALKANMPLWQEPGAHPLAGAYSLPLETIQRLGVPVINWGPYGRGAHQRDESLLMSYSFGLLPQLLYETIQHLIEMVC